MSKVVELHFFGEKLVNFLPIAMERGDDNVRRLISAKLDDEIGEIGLERFYAGRFESGVQVGLVGSHRLHFDHFGFLVGLDQARNDFVGFVRIARPVDVATGGEAVAFELFEIEIKMAKGVLLDGMAGVAQLLPIGKFVDNLGALAANDSGGVADVVAELSIADEFLGGFGEAGSFGGMADANAHGLAPLSTPARISARCRHLTPVRWRLKAPLMCMRQELSTAEQTSAPLSRMRCTLSESMAAETSGFLMAKVPPKPQHCSLSGRSTSVRPRTSRSKRAGLSPTRRERRE